MTHRMMNRILASALGVASMSVPMMTAMPTFASTGHSSGSTTTPCSGYTTSDDVTTSENAPENNGESDGATVTVPFLGTFSVSHSA